MPELPFFVHLPPIVQYEWLSGELTVIITAGIGLGHSSCPDKWMPIIVLLHCIEWFSYFIPHVGGTHVHVQLW